MNKSKSNRHYFHVVHAKSKIDTEELLTCGSVRSLEGIERVAYFSARQAKSSILTPNALVSKEERWMHIYIFRRTFSLPTRRNMEQYNVCHENGPQEGCAKTAFLWNVAFFLET